MGKISMMAGAAVGYIFGTRAGRERYEQLKSKAQGVWSDPRVQRKASAAVDVAKEKAPADLVNKAKRAAGAQPSNNEGPDNRQPAPSAGIQPPPSAGIQPPPPVVEPPPPTGI
jgi:hypothetical protein